MDPQLLMMLLQMGQEQTRREGEGAGKFINSFNDPGRSYGNAERAYDFNLDRATNEYQPYAQAGQGAINPFQQRLQDMSDPGQFINKAMSQYQQSPYATYLQKQSQRAGTNYASANGLSGSTPMAQYLQQNAHDISSGDMENYLKHFLGINTDYMAGQNKLMNNGLTAATGRSGFYNQAAPWMGNAEYGKERSRNMNDADRFSGLMQMFGG